MPVPVPYITKQVAHPVIKNHHSGDAQTGPFEDLTSTLPELPSRPPPSLGTREEWLKSLPSWRREKPRRIWEEDIRPNKGFTQGCAVAGHAAANQGTCAQAHLPSLRNMMNGADVWNMGDDLSSDYAGKGPESPKIRPPWGTRRADVDRRSASMDFKWRANLGSNRLSLGLSCAADAPYYGHSYERGTFTPVSEHDSPGFNSGPDGDCSPMEPEPITPFGAFVDRVVGAAVACGANPPFGSDVSHQQDDYAAPIYPSIAEPLRESPSAPALEPPVTPTASAGYKRLTEPLSGWIVNYVWRACTTGFSLAPIFARSCKTATQYPESPPQHLAPAVHSLLLSTLLQPSAVLLGMWYIIRLPIYFNAAALGVEYSKAMEFRSALFSQDYAGLDPEKLEESAPFRLIVLGFMLANKWLDDHTFSNKTWHTISKISLPSLNTLESLALEIFCYDLNVTSWDWSQWLEHVLSYHLSLTSPSCLQPISRPSSNPHSLIRKALEEIAQAPAACTVSANLPQPVFIGLEERRREQSEMDLRMHEAIEIDLDEDGPLRQEYLPKRRFGIMGPTTAALSRDVDQRTGGFGKCSGEWSNVKPLPPPAKWSPAADEPIFRESNRISGHYVAVRAPGHPYAFQGPYDSADNQNWNPAGHFMAPKQLGYIYDLPPIHLPPIPVFNGFNYVPHLHVYHARSQSLVYDNRPYVEGDLGNGSLGQPLLANDPAMANHADSRWRDGGLHSYPPPAFVALPGIGFQSAWLSA